MKTIYVSDDGLHFADEAKCRSHEVRKSLTKTPYALEIENMTTKNLKHAAFGYAKWLREKQDYPATDSGEHHCCDLLVEMAGRL